MNNKNKNSRDSNTNNNVFIINNKTQRIVNNGRFSANQTFTEIENNNFLFKNNERKQTYEEIRNNIGEKISEKIIKPSNSKTDNYIKRNSRQMNKVLQIKDKKFKKDNKNKLKKSRKYKKWIWNK